MTTTAAPSRSVHRCATCLRSISQDAYQCSFCARIPKAGVVDLLAAVLHRAPKLENAACRHHPKLFDGDTAEDIAAATAICKYGCPVLTECRAWLKVVPKRLRPIGVAGGRLYGFRVGQVSQPTTEMENEL